MPRRSLFSYISYSFSRRLSIGIDKFPLPPVKSIFNEPLPYLCIFINQIVFPLVALGVLTLLGLDGELKWCMYVMCACPIASVVLNYAELVGQGQEMAAKCVLLGTLSCIVTLPVLSLLIGV